MLGSKEQLSKASRELRRRSVSFWARTSLNDREEQTAIKDEFQHMFELLVQTHWAYLRRWCCRLDSTMPRARPEWNWTAWESSAVGELGRPACSTDRTWSTPSLCHTTSTGTSSDNARLAQERAMALAVFSPEYERWEMEGRLSAVTDWFCWVSSSHICRFHHFIFLYIHLQ